MKHNVNNLLAQYAQELGENLDDIEPQYNEDNVFDDDPDLKIAQQQLNMLSNNLNAKIGGQQPKVDIYDQLLDDYEQPKKQQPQQYQQQQPQVTQQQKNTAPDITLIEQQLTIPGQLNSLRVLKQEIGFINSNIIPNLKKVPAAFSFYQNLVSQLQNQQQILINQIKEEKLDAKGYQQRVQQTFDREQNKFKEQKDQKFKNRIGLRCKTMFEELGLLKDKKFDKICTEFGCAPDTSSKFLYEEFNTKPFKQKAKELFTRHKEWLNLTQYLTNNMKDDKRDFIQYLISKLEISKQIQNKLKEGENVEFGQFFILEFKEITEEQFLGISKVEYQARIQNMIDQVNQANKEEQQYYKVASVAKPIVQMIPGTKQMQKINPGDVSKQYFARYEQLLKYLNELKDSKWTPLPILRTDAEQRDVSTVNKDVPQNILRIQFKEITGADKYYLTYEIPIGGQVYQGKTEQANGDGKLNYTQDINLRDYRNASKEIHQAEITVKAFKKGWISSDLKGQGKIYLSDLLDMSTYDGTISLGSNKALIFTIQMRESINKKKTVSVAQIIKTYPSFDKNDGLENYLTQKLSEIPDAPKAVKRPEPQVVQPQQPQQQQQVEEQEQEAEEDQAPKLRPDQLVALIHLESDEEYKKVLAFAETVPKFKEELLYPENPVNGSVFYFLQQYKPFIEKKIGEFRSIPDLRMQSRFCQKLFEDCCRQNIKLQKQLEVDIEGYKKNLEMVIKKDQMFLKIYQKEQALTWAKFIEGRLEIALKEQEALSQM